LHPRGGAPRPFLRRNVEGVLDGAEFLESLLLLASAQLPCFRETPGVDLYELVRAAAAVIVDGGPQFGDALQGRGVTGEEGGEFLQGAVHGRGAILDQPQVALPVARVLGDHRVEHPDTLPVLAVAHLRDRIEDRELAVHQQALRLLDLAQGPDRGGDGGRKQEQYHAEAEQQLGACGEVVDPVHGTGLMTVGLKG